MNQELPDVQAGFRKGRGTRDQIAVICWIIEKAREFQEKKSTFASLTTLMPLTMQITINYGKFLKRWEYQTILPVSWETCMKVKKQQLELDMKQAAAAAKLLQSCLTLCDPMDSSPAGSSGHGIL